MPADFSYNIIGAAAVHGRRRHTEHGAHHLAAAVGPARRAAAGAAQPRRRHRPGQAVRLAAGDGDPRRPAQRGVLRRQPGRRTRAQLLPARRTARRPPADGRLRGAVRRRRGRDAAASPSSRRAWSSATSSPTRRGRTVAPTCTPATSPRGSRSRWTASAGCPSTSPRRAPRRRRSSDRAPRRATSPSPIPPPPPPQPPDVQVVVPNVTTTTTRTSRSTLNAPGSVEGATGWTPLRWTVTGGSSIVLLRGARRRRHRRGQGAAPAPAATGTRSGGAHRRGMERTGRPLRRCRRASATADDAARSGAGLPRHRSVGRRGARRTARPRRHDRPRRVPRRAAGRPVLQRRRGPTATRSSPRWSAAATSGNGCACTWRPVPRSTATGYGRTSERARLGCRPRR